MCEGGDGGEVDHRLASGERGVEGGWNQWCASPDGDVEATEGGNVVDAVERDVHRPARGGDAPVERDELEARPSLRVGGCGRSAAPRGMQANLVIDEVGHETLVVRGVAVAAKV